MKNNKTIINIFLSVIIILLISTSCDDKLDLVPISQYTVKYETESDINGLVNGVYANLQDLYSYDKIPFCQEGRSDNVKTTDDNSYDATLMGKFTDDENTGAVASIWKESWKIINTCNDIIANIDNITFSDSNALNYKKGEALFLRGYAYFQLGWMYGGVPLIDKTLTSEELLQLSRSTQDETLAFAVTDLISAANLLPDTWVGSDLGRATKYAAKGILARLYMFQNNTTAAKPLLKEIIDSKNYKMAETYVDCFLDSKDNSPEHVFQIQFASGDCGEGNVLPVVCAPEAIDDVLFPSGGGSPYLRVSDDLYDSYEPGDIRRDINIRKGYIDKSGTVDGITCFYIKYNHGAIPSTKDDYEVNLPVLRYTDVKLMYAECLGNTSDALDIINEVRTRAGLIDYTSSDIPDDETFTDKLFQERRLEFAGEWMRWFDLVRTGEAQSVINTFLLRTENGSGKYSMDATQNIFAIPHYEFTIIPDLTQNPGYSK